MVFLAILTGIGGLFNYYGVTSATYSIIVAILLQVVLFLLTSLALVSYQGRRSRPSYDRGGYRIWTFSFALIILSFVGNLAILVVLLLNQLGYISGF